MDLDLLPLPSLVCRLNSLSLLSLVRSSCSSRHRQTKSPFLCLVLNFPATTTFSSIRAVWKRGFSIRLPMSSRPSLAVTKSISRLLLWGQSMTCRITTSSGTGPAAPLIEYTGELQQRLVDVHDFSDRHHW